VLILFRTPYFKKRRVAHYAQGAKVQFSWFSSQSLSRLRAVIGQSQPALTSNKNYGQAPGESPQVGIQVSMDILDILAIQGIHGIQGMPLKFRTFNTAQLI